MDLKVVLVVLEIPNHNCLLKMRMIPPFSVLYSGSVRNTDIGRLLLEF